MEGKYTGTRYVHAKGNVEARVWYTKRLESGFTREIIEETGIKVNSICWDYFMRRPFYKKQNDERKLILQENIQFFIKRSCVNKF